MISHANLVDKKKEDAEIKTLTIFALVGLVLAVGSAHPFGDKKGETLDNAELQDITNDFQAEDTER